MSFESSKPRMTMAERFDLAQQESKKPLDKKPSIEPKPRPVSLELLRKEVQQRESESLAPQVASERAKLLAEISGKNNTEQGAIFSRVDKSLAREEFLAQKFAAGEMNPGDPDEAEFFDFKGKNSTEDYEKQVRARRQAFLEIQTSQRKAA